MCYSTATLSEVQGLDLEVDELDHIFPPVLGEFKNLL